jgi:hypothetical protein
MKQMMQKPILSGRIEKWEYSLVEYDRSYEPLRAAKGQIVADFIINHNVKLDDARTVTVCPWK